MNLPVKRYWSAVRNCSLLAACFIAVLSEAFGYSHVISSYLIATPVSAVRADNVVKAVIFCPRTGSRLLTIDPTTLRCLGRMYTELSVDCPVVVDSSEFPSNSPMMWVDCRIWLADGRSLGGSWCLCLDPLAGYYMPDETLTNFDPNELYLAQPMVSDLGSAHMATILGVVVHE